MPSPVRHHSPHDPLDRIEDAVRYTISALQADPRTADLLGLTKGWIPALKETHALDRKARTRTVNAEARRVVSNENLDAACEAFGADLFEAVDGDRKSPRWTTFFEIPVASFVRQALDRQVAAVARWLERDDDVLEDHREALEQWSAAAGAAVEDTRKLALVRARAQIAREELALGINREREALLAALVEIAEDQGLPATWPDVFFTSPVQSTPAQRG